MLFPGKVGLSGGFSYRFKWFFFVLNDFSVLQLNNIFPFEERFPVVSHVVSQKSR